MKRLATAITFLAIVIPLHSAIAGSGSGSGADIAFYNPSASRFDIPGGSSFYYGVPGDTPLLCDWNGDGVATVGVYRESTGHLLLQDENITGAADYAFYYGIPGDRPLCGDWDGDGMDTIGIFRPSERKFYLRNVNSQGFGDWEYQFGFASGIPFAGDFNGDVKDTVGLRDPKNGFVSLAASHFTDQAVVEGYFGSSADELVVGDWDGDGIDRIAIYRPPSDTLAITNLFGSTRIAEVYDLGNVSGIPLAAEFNPATGVTKTHLQTTTPIAKPAAPQPVEEPPVQETPPVLAFTGEGGGPTATSGPGGFAYEALVNNEWQESWISGIPEDAVSMYYRWPGIDGLINTYRATGDTIHIDRALAMSHAYLERGQDTDGDRYLDWYSTWVDRYSHNHVEWRAADGVAAVVNVIHSDPALAPYRSQAAPLVEYLKRDVWQKWETSLDSPYPHFIGRLGLIALALSNATGDQQYQDYITQHGAALQAQIYDKGSFFWETDVSHLGDAVSFMVEAHLAGLVFTDADMQQLVSAAKLSWNDNPTAPQFKDYLDGQTAMTPVGRNQGGWIKLSLFDDELRSIYRAWADTSDIHDNTYIQAQVYGALALTATLPAP